MAPQQHDERAEPQPQPLRGEARATAPAGATADANADATADAGAAAAGGRAAGTDPATPEGAGEQAAGDPGEDGEIRAAERSAERAAALAATEGFHPLRIRPYVAEPDGEPDETTVRPVVAAEAADADGPATADLGLFPSMFSGLEYPPEEPSVMPPPVVVRGRHRRRRRSLVVAAAAVAASALTAGAVAVAGQVMGDEQGTTDQSMPDLSTSMPDVQLPHDSSPAAGTRAPAVTRHTATAPTTTTTPGATATPTPTVTPSAPATTATPPPATTTGTSGAPSTPPPVTPSDTTTTSAPPPRNQSVRPSGGSTLRPGDTGPAVTDLQRRLTEAHLYRGSLDGVYDRDVQLSVAAFQYMHHIHAQQLGSYDATTRAALEHTTH